jgi:uncharacterized protein YneF (UPF0154 family)
MNSNSLRVLRGFIACTLIDQECADLNSNIHADVIREMWHSVGQRESLLSIS